MRLERNNSLEFAKLRQQPLFLLTVVILAFIIAIVSVSTVKMSEMGTDPLFVFEVIPFPYWIGIFSIVAALFFMVSHLNDKRFRLLFIFSSVLLMICFRMIFPIVFTSIPAFEPDAAGYLDTVNSWVQKDIDFGTEEDYRHNYPAAFIVAFAFVKLGVPIDFFFRIAPFIIYALDIVFLYLIVEKFLPEDKKKTALSVLPVFLFSFSSLGYWVTVHYCPDLFGSLMFFVSLYLAIRFAKSGQWNIKLILPVLVSLFILILSHHLSALYLIVTLLGFSVSMWFFKLKQFKNGMLVFFILAIYTYTAWFVYGSLVYPSFFNVYVYFSGFTSAATQSADAGLLNNILFFIYPVFVSVLFLYELFKTLKIQSPVSLVKNLQFSSLTSNIRAELYNIRIIGADNNTVVVFSAGFALIFLTFLIGLGVPVLFGSRILEVLCIGLYPLSSQALIKLADNNSSRKKAIIFAIILLVVLTGIYRYYSQIQRRVIL